MTTEDSPGEGVQAHSSANAYRDQPIYAALQGFMCGPYRPELDHADVTALAAATLALEFLYVLAAGQQ